MTSHPHFANLNKALKGKPMKMEYGHKGTSGAYGKPGKGGKNPLKGKPMPKGPKEVKPSQKGYVA